MKKIVTLGATTLTALTLLGAAQPLVHASQVGETENHVALKNKATVAEATTAVNNLFTDGAAATKLKTNMYRADLKSALDKVLTLDDTEPDKATLLTKIGTAWDLHGPLHDVDSTKKIFTAASGKASDYIENVFTDSTHTKLKSGYVTAIIGLSKTVSEQYVNASGYTTIDWEHQGSFTTFLDNLAQAKTLADVPETAAQDLVDALFKDTTYAELNTGTKLEKIEDARKAVNALNDSAEKTGMLKLIGDAYGMYFIVDANGMTAGDALGDKVKENPNMKTLHDFVEAATDFEAEVSRAI
ncbi:toxin Cry1Ac domain D-VI-related protein [Lactococcus garvieae]|uniref:Pesticidal crystal protein Cry1Aa domain-containing protein n=1 Tax=Lactococcus garvieae DCC43 TaxID=1231377 RepID=K2PUV3_9LACT|nr:toxin Cry1Ac domain D-VI-related protein [Lactococcus garvieae]EKF51221.1 hypothetical protein C426_1360 [Lactococcus garvieae DCC43]